MTGLLRMRGAGGAVGGAARERGGAGLVGRGHQGGEAGH